MGWWSNHPMGGDDPMDYEDDFLSVYREEAEKICPPGEDPFEWADSSFLKGKLESLSLADLRSNRMISYCPTEYLYVIPYAFYQFSAFNLSDEVKAYLNELLLKSVKCYSKDVKSTLNKVVRPTNKTYFKHVLEVFLEYFDDIITGKRALEGDAGLLATIFESNKKLANKTDPTSK